MLVQPLHMLTSYLSLLAYKPFITTMAGKQKLALNSAHGVQELCRCREGLLTAQSPSNEALLPQLSGVLPADALGSQPLQQANQLERAISLKGLVPAPGGHIQGLSRDLAISGCLNYSEGPFSLPSPSLWAPTSADWPASRWSFPSVQPCFRLHLSTDVDVKGTPQPTMFC